MQPSDRLVLCRGNLIHFNLDIYKTFFNPPSQCLFQGLSDDEGEVEIHGKNLYAHKNLNVNVTSRRAHRDAHPARKIVNKCRIMEMFLMAAAISANKLCMVCPSCSHATTVIISIVLENISARNARANLFP